MRCCSRLVVDPCIECSLRSGVAFSPRTWFLQTTRKPDLSPTPLNMVCESLKSRDSLTKVTHTKLTMKGPTRRESLIIRAETSARKPQSKRHHCACYLTDCCSNDRSTILKSITCILHSVGNGTLLDVSTIAEGDQLATGNTQTRALLTTFQAPTASNGAVNAHRST